MEILSIVMSQMKDFEGRRGVDSQGLMICVVFRESTVPSNPNTTPGVRNFR